MQTQPYDDQNGARCWLSRNEQQAISQYWSEQPQKHLAVRLALHGLRGAEVVQVAKDDVRQLDTDREAYALTIQDGKTGHRETPIKADTRHTMQIYANASGTHAGEPLIDVSTKSVRRWIQEAARNTLDADEREHVGPHDLRRTWATDTFWSLGGGPQCEVTVMNWGGWKLNERGRETFRENYLGSIPDHVAAQLQDEAGLL